MIVFSPRAVVKSAVRGLKSLLGFFDNPLVFAWFADRVLGWNTYLNVSDRSVKLSKIR